MAEDAPKAEANAEENTKARGNADATSREANNAERAAVKAKEEANEAMKAANAAEKRVSNAKALLLIMTKQRITNSFIETPSCQVAILLPLRGLHPSFYTFAIIS